MVGLDQFKVAKVKEDGFFGIFSIGPFPRGYGYTVSNSLRRILLSSIKGAAVTGVKINGAKHEYSTIEGLQEDVINLVLKLKELAIIKNTEGKSVLKLSVKGKKNQPLVVKAEDFELPSDVEIVNGDLEVATLTKDVNYDVEATVEQGTGYGYADESKREELGMIPVDAIYSPVKRVQAEVSKARVGQDTNLDQINLYIYTNGTIKPAEALLKAAEIYDQLANRLVDMLGGDSENVMPISSAAENKEKSEEKKILISELNLSTRLTNALLNAGITDLHDVAKYKRDDVGAFRGMGKKSLTELDEMLEKKALKYA
jgi:DNA-directed RNA polymerase subunit alpha